MTIQSQSLVILQFPVLLVPKVPIWSHPEDSSRDDFWPNIGIKVFRAPASEGAHDSLMAWSVSDEAARPRSGHFLAAFVGTPRHS